MPVFVHWQSFAFLYNLKEYLSCYEAWMPNLHLLLCFSKQAGMKSDCSGAIQWHMLLVDFLSLLTV